VYHAELEKVQDLLDEDKNLREAMSILISKEEKTTAQRKDIYESRALLAAELKLFRKIKREFFAEVAMLRAEKKFLKENECLNAPVLWPESTTI